MANQQHLDILKQGVATWNQWRKEHPDIRPDLSKADLQRASLNNIDLHDAELARIDFYGAELREANLQKANLHMAHLYRTDFSEANLSGAILRGSDLVRARLIGTNLCEADLRWIKLGEADLSRANLTGSSVYGVSAWDVKLENATQSGLAITSDGSPTVTVDNLEIAQFIYMLINYRKLRDALDSVMKKGVLILGRFSDGGLELLQAIAEELRKNQYLPMIFDFERPDTKDYTETVITLVGLSRFVIVDLSGPSVPHELYATVPHFNIPFVPILDKSRKAHFTFRDLPSKYPWVLKTIKFSNEKHLLKVILPRIIQQAEAKIDKKAKRTRTKGEK